MFRSCELDVSESGQGPVADSCKHGNELLDSINDENFLTLSVTVDFSRKALLHEISYK